MLKLRVKRLELTCFVLLMHLFHSNKSFLCKSMAVSMFITLDSFNISAKNFASASMQPSLLEMATPLQSSLVHSNSLLLFSWHKKFQPPFAFAVRIVLLHRKHLEISYVLQTATRSCKLSHKMVKIKLQRASKQNRRFCA